MYVCVYATHAIILTIKKMMITIIIIMRNSHLTTKLANSIINNILFFIFCVWLFLERFVLIFVFTLLSFFFSSYFLDFSKFFITIHNNIYIYIYIYVYYVYDENSSLVMLKFLLNVSNSYILLDYILRKNVTV